MTDTRRSVQTSAESPPRACDVKNEADLVQLLVGHDAAIHWVTFQSSDPHEVLGAAKKAGGEAS
jgi:hypothetical protein